MRRLRDERGVAMTTVLFVGAVLTAVTSVAAFTTIQEFNASLDDRKAAEALSIAEAGVDRMLEFIRSGDIGWGEIRLAGCTAGGITYDPIVIDGKVGRGDFTAELRVYDRAAADACVGRSTDIRDPDPLEFAITSRGRHSAATRRVRQVIRIAPLHLPIGIFAETANANGSPDMNEISLITSGNITGRNNIAFSGDDHYYLRKDFWPAIPNGGEPIPAAAHAIGTIYLRGTNQPNNVEHPPGQTLNCTANNARGTPGSSQWDQSGGGGTITQTTPCAGQAAAPPPTSLFTTTDLEDRVAPKPKLSEGDYLALRDTAKRTGIYCFFPTAGGEQCTRLGTGWTYGGLVDQDDVDAVIAVNRTFVAYFEYENPNKALTTNEVHWKANVTPCHDDPKVNASMVMITRNGSFQTEAGSGVPGVPGGFMNGAFLVPEGRYEHRGSQTINGTIIAKEFLNQGNGKFQVNQCWLNNLPGPFLDITPADWMELDRPQ